MDAYGVVRRNRMRTFWALWMVWFLYERDIDDRGWAICFLREAFWSSRHQRPIALKLRCV